MHKRGVVENWIEAFSALCYPNRVRNGEGHIPDKHRFGLLAF